MAKLKIEILDGVAGLSLYINDYRIAGPKPLGGGTVLKTWLIDKRSFLNALTTINILKPTEDEK